MTVGRDYMLKKGAPPSWPKLLLNIKIVPRAVNLAGAVEVALARASMRSGVRPVVILGGCAAIMLFTAVRFQQKRSENGEVRL